MRLNESIIISPNGISDEMPNEPWICRAGEATNCSAKFSSVSNHQPIRLPYR